MEKGKIKIKKKTITLLIIAFFICVNTVYGEEIKNIDGIEYIYLTSEEFNKLPDSFKVKFKKVDGENSYRIVKSQIFLEYFSVNPKNDKRKKPEDGSNNSNNDGAYGENAVAIGEYAKATNRNALSIGWSSHATGSDSVAIGFTAFAKEDNSNAVGAQAGAYSEEASAFGNQSKAIGFATTAIGNNSMSIENGATSIGYFSTASNSSVALGTKSLSYGIASVAIGQGSYIGDLKLKKEFEKYGGDYYSYYSEVISKDANKMKEYKEKFKDKLKDFKKDGHDYDAILKSLILSDLNKNIGFSVAVGNKAMIGTNFGSALGYGTYVSEEGGIALGSYSVADKSKDQLGYCVMSENGNLETILKMTDKKEKYEKNKKIIEDKKDAYNAMVTRLKNGNTEEEKERIKLEIKEWLNKNNDFMPAIKENKNIISIWKSSTGAVSIGKEGYTRQITNLSAGSEDTDAVNVAQLKAMRSYVDKKVTLKAGKSAYDIWATSSKAVEYANKHNKELKDLTELDFIDSLKGEQGIKGDGESAYQSWLKQNGNVGKSEEDFVKWLKGDKGDKGQDGKDGKDGKSAFEVWKEKKNKPNAKEEDFFKDITKGAGLLAKEKEEMNKKIEDANKKSDLALGGVSNAVAMANLPQVMGDKKFNLAASYGYYGGSHAVAVGFSGTNDKQNFIYKLSGSVNNKGNLAFGIGAGIMLGEVNNKDKKIENLEKTNKELLERVAKLEKLLSK